MNTTLFPSVTAGGPVLSPKHPQSLSGYLPTISFFQITEPSLASQHQMEISFPVVSSAVTGFMVVKKTLPFETTGVLWPVSGNSIFQAIF